MASNNEELYGPYDGNFCRTFKPIEEARNFLVDSPNRYHNYLAHRIDDALFSVYLVKPVTGFVSQAHSDFFSKSWAGNAGLAYIINPSYGFRAGKVYRDLSPSLYRYVVGRGINPVSDAIQPFRNSKNGPDDVRAIWEDFWISGKAIRFPWKAAVDSMQNADAKYKFRGKSSLEALKLEYPGWRPDDGSKPELPAQYA